MKPYKTLTDSYIKAAKPKDKPYKIAETARLYLLVSTAGSKHWKWNYRLDGKDCTYSIGEYPKVGLAKAKELRDEAIEIVDQGFHPLQYKKIQQAKKQQEVATTFWGVAVEWIEHKKPSWSPSYAKQVELTVGRYIRDGKIGLLPIKQITAADIFELITGVAKRDVRKGVERRDKAPNLAILLRQWCSGIFRHAIVSGRADVNPVAALNAGDMITRPKVKHNRALNQDELRSLLESLHRYGGMRSTSIAIELLMLTFVRTGELIQAEWPEFDLEKKVWVIPASRMKIKGAGDHLVPLSSQVVVLLKELKHICGKATQGKPKWLFRNIRNPDKCMSPTTINRALERMGFNGKDSIGFSAHGFRGTASTMLHENGSRTDIIEMQLAHKEPNSVKAAYNRAQYIPERVVMMQFWADYLQTLKAVD